MTLGAVVHECKILNQNLTPLWLVFQSIKLQDVHLKRRVSGRQQAAWYEVQQMVSHVKPALLSPWWSLAIRLPQVVCWLWGNTLCHVSQLHASCMQETACGSDFS